MACVLNLSRVTWRSSFVTGASSSVEERSAAGRLRNVAEHVIASVDSEFPETDLRFAMQCFDMAKVRVGMADGGGVGADILLRGIEFLWQRYWWLTRICCLIVQGYVTARSSLNA